MADDPCVDAGSDTDEIADVEMDMPFSAYVVVKFDCAQVQIASNVELSGNVGGGFIKTWHYEGVSAQFEGVPTKVLCEHAKCSAECKAFFYRYKIKFYFRKRTHNSFTAAIGWIFGSVEKDTISPAWYEIKEFETRCLCCKLADFES